MDGPSDSSPLLDLRHPIPFDRITADQIVGAIDVLLGDAQQRLRALERDSSLPTYDNTLHALEQVTERLGRAMGVVSHLESVATTPELREAHEKVQPKVSAFYSTITLSSAVFERLRELSGSKEAAALDPTRARFLARTLESFEREGAGLGLEDKARLQVINVELSELTTRFSHNVLDSTNAFELVLPNRARLSGLPERALEAAQQSARAKGQKGYRLTLNEPSLLAVLTYAGDAALREQIYRAHNARASGGDKNNRGVILRILELRREKARMLGYRDFVDLVLDERMAQKGDRARAFLLDLDARSRSAYEHERQELLAFRREIEGPDAKDLEPWDLAYYAEKQRAKRYDLDEEALRPYFPLDRVLAGLFELAARLYGISVEPADELTAWHPSVRGYRVRDADRSSLGVFYADLFPREQKRGGAWMNALITAERAGAGWTEHVGLICGNLTPPLGEGPALLSHREVETVFHETGHLLHHMLSRVEVKSLAGTNVAWDFVELPSQIMENFCWERESLNLFAKHHESGESIPEPLFARMQRARTYRGATAMMRQLGFGLTDLQLHMEYDAAQHGDAVEYGRRIMSAFVPADLPPDYAMLASFGHLFSHPVGYAGGYYSYKWAEVLDANAFARFREHGLFSSEIGREFREKILARGDSREPMELFVDFMGREPDLRPLLERAGIQD
jgi:oligopeptidase A